LGSSANRPTRAFANPVECANLPVKGSKIGFRCGPKLL
jgi:hypothetical protein